MRILHSWLQQYIDFKLKPEILAEKLGMLGLEIEHFERLDERYSGFVVGKVLSVAPHPNADRLSVCVVDVGDSRVQLVCGAPNVAAGQKVVVGNVGATVPKNQHDPSGKPFVLGKATIRGVESSGMICSEYELDLGKDAEGIMVLEGSAKVGQPVVRYFDLEDIAYDIEVTPNRPDWLSHYGVAREIGVILGRRPRLPSIKLKESRIPIRDHFAVKIEDKTNCLRFAARMIRGANVGPSPRWIQNALRNTGLRPINNIVDVTNYVMLECGQPLHAFDYDLLEGHRVIVRRAGRPIRFTTLDGKDRLLDPETVMVCDAKREVSIAGIMGGANSEINESTRDVVLESACWNPVSIRKTRRQIGVSTDASQRFERGTDIEGVWYALQRATQLIRETAGGEVLQGTLDAVSRPIRNNQIELRTDRVNEILGTSLRTTDILGFLHILGIDPSRRGRDRAKLRIPLFRVDLEREIDLIEEVARVYGYDNIGEKSTASIDFSQPLGKKDPADEVRQVLVGFGYHEALSYSLQEPKTAEMEGVVPVRLLNPRTSENSTLRTSLVPGLLGAVARNASFGTTDVRLFEIGKVYQVDQSGGRRLVENFAEQERVCLVLSGNRSPRHWSTAPEPADLFDLKGDVSDLLDKFALDKRRLICYSTSNRLAENTIAIDINGSYAGWLGTVAGDVLRDLGVEREVFVAEFSLESLGSGRKGDHFIPLPRYPGVKRDVSFVVDDSTTFEEVERVMRSESGSLVQSVELFDLYRGEHMLPGKKSLGFTLELMSRERTLTDNEIDQTVKNVVEAVQREIGAVLRGA